MSSYNDNKPFKTFKPIKIGLGEKIVGSVKDFFKSRGRKVSPDIKSVKPGKKFNKGGRVGLKLGSKKKSVAKGDIIYTDDEGKQYGVSKRELGVMGAGGDKQASKALKRMKNHTFIYPDKILREKKAKGGRVGLKRGTGLMKKKSNVQKIKETFGPKNKSTKFGMLSVKAGIDKNPNPTQADRIAGAKMKSKKRFV